MAAQQPPAQPPDGRAELMIFNGAEHQPHGRCSLGLADNIKAKQRQGMRQG